MSSLIQDDADKQLIHALPWVSDPQRQDETRRLQEQVVEAAQRLERESSGLAPQPPAQPPQRRAEVSFKLANAYAREEMTGRLWSSLEPDIMPPPPREELRMPGLGLIAAFFGAVGVAAAIALVVANVVRIPTINAAVSSEEEAGSSRSFSTTILGNLPQIEAAQANVQPGEARSAQTGPTLATTQTDAVAAATPLTAAPPASPKVEPVQSDTKPPPAAAVPKPRAAVSLTHDEIASMLKRGEDLIAAGDIASARLILTHLAEAGDAEASFVLAGTFDAAVLANLRVVGVQPDPAKARAWYARAAEYGSLEAKQRLSALR